MSDLVGDELRLTGRISTASNATFLAQIDDIPVVYKPIAGEKPLWDFPHGTLADREVSAYLVSEALGWNIVPRTWLREGPLGLGMVQLWQELDPEQDAVTIVPSREMPDRGWRRVFDGADDDDKPVTLIHEDSDALRRMAVFDILVNNADRKGAHILELADGHRHGVDHGLTFHAEHKLRTVLWGWVGQPLSADELDAVARIRELADGTLGDELSLHISPDELDAFIERCDDLHATARFPAPHGEMPALPWPLF